MTVGTPTRIAGGILAGGKGLRLGGVEKARLVLNGGSFLDHALAALSPVTSSVAVALRPEQDAPELPGCTALVRDEVEAGTRSSPLAGVIALLKWTESLGHASHLLTLTVDTPFFGRSHAERLASAAGPAPAYAAQGGDTHGLHAIWPVALLPRLEALLAEAPDSSVRKVLEGLGAMPCPFGPEDRQAFLNVNTPGDLEQAQRIAAAHHAAE